MSQNSNIVKMCSLSTTSATCNAHNGECNWNSKPIDIQAIKTIQENMKDATIDQKTMLFDFYDENKDGKIDIQEIQHSRTKLGETPEPDAKIMETVV